MPQFNPPDRKTRGYMPIGVNAPPKAPPGETPAGVLAINFEPASDTTPTFYINGCNLAAGSSDFHLLVGILPTVVDPNNIPKVYPTARLVMTHDTLVRIAGIIGAQARLFELLYDGAVPNLSGLTTEKLAQANAQLRKEQEEQMRQTQEFNADIKASTNQAESVPK